MYRIEPDLTNPKLIYIYKDTENGTAIKLTVYNDYELARRIIKELNREEYSEKDNEHIIEILKEESTVEVGV